MKVYDLPQLFESQQLGDTYEEYLRDAEGTRHHAPIKHITDINASKLAIRYAKTPRTVLSRGNCGISVPISKHLEKERKM